MHPSSTVMVQKRAQLNCGFTICIYLHYRGFFFKKKKRLKKIELSGIDKKLSVVRYWLDHSRPAPKWHSTLVDPLRVLRH